MIDGAHVIIYSTDAAADREFLRAVLGFRHVDAGDGWLIFDLPPAEVGVHPTDVPAAQELYLMCDDVDKTVEELAGADVEFTEPITDQGWGRVTKIRLPGGGEVGLYEPRHERATER